VEVQGDADDARLLARELRGEAFVDGTIGGAIALQDERDEDARLARLGANLAQVDRAKGTEARDVVGGEGPRPGLVRLVGGDARAQEGRHRADDR
jgi:hypothetical protein